MKRAASVSISIILVLALALMLGGASASAAEGDLELGFGTGGRVLTPIGTGNDLAQAIAVQPDGKIVVAGYARSGTSDDFAVIRYNPNGALDNTFDADGKVTTSFGGNNDQGQAVAVQPDGKIVVAGTSNNGADDDFAVVRYNANGSLDTTFSGDGRATIAMGSAGDAAYAVAIEPDGKIVVAGDVDGGPRVDIGVARLTTTGAPDTTFSADGIASAKFGGNASAARAVGVQADGSIVVAGYVAAATGEDFAVVRLTTAGALDATFDTDGKASTPVGTSADMAQALAIQTDGNIVLAGTTAAASNDDFAVVRYTATGALDPTFDADGIVTTAVGSSNDRGQGVVVQSDGKVVVAGAAAGASNDDFAVVRYTATGALDTNFSADGRLTTTVGTGADLGQAVAVAPDADILVAGYASNGTNNDFALTRHVGDQTPPNTTIDSGPSGTVATTDATFTFSANDTSATFQCQLDGGAYLSCTSPQSYPGVTQGAHTFSVKATDAAGNEDPSPATRSWTVDTGPPNTTITGGPTGTVNSADASFTFESSESGSTFECRLDGGVYSACTSPSGYTGLSEGSHTFEVRAADQAGNIDPSPATRTWTVDTTPPDTILTSGPSGTVNSSSATFTFTSPDATASFLCQLDGGAFSACSSPRSYTGLSEGAHTFSVRAVDGPGNEDPSPATRSWTVDTVAPNTTITTGPSGTVGVTDATFTFSSSEGGSTFQCRLDGGAYSACTSPRSYTGLAAGSHTFEVRATDGAGNTDASPATRTWTIDATAPDTTITSGPSGTVNTTSATFSFTSDDPSATFQCEMDSGGFSPCTSPANYSGLSSGIHTFRVRAIDGVGNMDPSAASRTWTIDIVGPVTTITSGPSGTLTTTGATFTFAANEPGSTFECKLDAASFAPCASPVSYAGLADGSHTFQVRATDSANNVEATPASRTWTIDTVAPNTTITSGPSGVTTSTNATFTFAANDGSATFRCKLDAAAYAPCISPLTHNGLADGSHTFSVKAVDPAGNEDPTPATRTWTVDTTVPDTTIDSGPSGVTNAAAATFSFSSSEGGATFACKLDGGVFAPCTSPALVGALSDGAHTFQVRATDAAGNVDPSPATRTWTVDTVAPDTTLGVGGPSGTTIQTSASFDFVSPDPTATFECSLDGGGFSPCTSPTQLSSLSVGDHAFSVRAVDPAGNRDATPASRTWTVTTPTYRPDAMIKALTSAAYIGDGAYSASASGQTINRKIGAGKTASYGFAFQNDGDVIDELTVEGCGTQGSFLVNYAAGVDVTNRVVDGTYSAGSLAPGVDYRLTFSIKAKAKAKKGTVFNCMVSATSATDPGHTDAVKVTLTVK